MLAVAFGAAAIAGLLSRAASSGSVGAASTHGTATAAPVINFKRLTLRKKRQARHLMGRERETLPDRWQQKQERLERIRAAGRLPAPTPGPAKQFRAEPVTSPSPPLGTSFNAVDDNGLFIPPDTEGAPGLDKLMVTVNGTVQIQNKNDGSVVSTTTLDAFFAGVPGVSFAFDPHVLYDPSANRWIVVADTNAESSSSALLLAVSQTSDPTGSWNEYSVDVDPANAAWADYPTVGFNKNWIVVSVNMFSLAVDSFVGTQTYAFDKAKAYAGGAGAGGYQLFKVAGDDFTLAPAATYDPDASDLYLAEDYDGGSSRPLRLFRLSGPVGSATLTRLGDPAGASLSALGPWSDVSGGARANGFAPQLGSTRKIDSGDARLSQCVERNAAIWCANTVFIPAAAPTRSVVQWYEIDPGPATPNVIHGGRIGDATGQQFFAYPSIAVNKYNDALLGFSRFSSTQYASADYAYHSCSDTSDTFRTEAPYQPGLGSYYKTYGGGVNRWGDYSGTWVDPGDDQSLWTIQEYAKLFTGPNSSKNPGTWGTWWGLLPAQAHTGPGAPSPESSDHTRGVASTNGVIHVGWTPPDDCAVSYVYKWSTNPVDPPSPATDATLPRDAVSLVSPQLGAGSSWWLHLEAVDAGGAPSPVADLGPFPIVSPATPSTTTSPPPACVVPAVRRLLLATARTKLRAAHCSVGLITRRFSRTVANGRVISQGATPGKQLASGAAVSLLVSKGRAPFRPPLRVTLCYRHHTVHVTRAVAKRLRGHGATLGACRRR